MASAGPTHRQGCCVRHLPGAITGRCPCEDLEPLEPEGTPLTRLTSVSLEEAAKIQQDYTEGFASLGVQIAIRDALAARAPTKPRREACDPIWMIVRGVMMARRGFPQTAAGWEAFEALPREFTEDGTRVRGRVELCRTHPPPVALFASRARNERALVRGNCRAPR